MPTLPQKLPYDLHQTQWASILNPVLRNPLVNGLLLTDIVLATGDNNIEHRLGREPQGYLITGMRSAFAQIYQKQAQLPKLFLTLNSSGPTTVDIYVF